MMQSVVSRIRKCFLAPKALCVKFNAEGRTAARPSQAVNAPRFDLHCDDRELLNQWLTERQEGTAKLKVYIIFNLIFN